MKIPGRIVIILATFFLVGAIFVVAVNTLAPNRSGFRNRPEGGFNFRPQNGNFFFNGNRPPEGFDGNRREGDRRGGFGLSGMMLGAIRNTLIVALFVVIIVWPKSIARKKRISTNGTGSPA